MYPCIYNTEIPNPARHQVQLDCHPTFAYAYPSEAFHLITASGSGYFMYVLRYCPVLCLRDEDDDDSHAYMYMHMHAHILTKTKMHTTGRTHIAGQPCRVRRAHHGLTPASERQGCCKRVSNSMQAISHRNEQGKRAIRPTNNPKCDIGHRCLVPETVEMGQDDPSNSRGIFTFQHEVPQDCCRSTPQLGSRQLPAGRRCQAIGFGRLPAFAVAHLDPRAG